MKLSHAKKDWMHLSLLRSGDEQGRAMILRNRSQGTAEFLLLAIRFVFGCRIGPGIWERLVDALDPDWIFYVCFAAGWAIIINGFWWNRRYRLKKRMMNKSQSLRSKYAARARKTKPSARNRKALEQVLPGNETAGGDSCADLCADLFEGLEEGGPRDLATNPKRLAGLGK